ncbi:hypothetical protein [Bdellovibrio svalbardensis]|uniref:Secreted protein n=1 Tax=Bdellovibrio svalbardensis TaxID=2972972 RepID=A0ABT6DJZ9_9BACT|nr:hypothetical protein [Bdellovibrio svalbardensis]MDG0817193.1 hypothetical protein [Bdellovibrio svalbardensis]
MIKFFSIAAVIFFGSLNVYADASNCNPTGKYYCACEDITHGGYYQISFMKLDYSSGNKAVISALKQYNDDPVFRIEHTNEDIQTYNKCLSLMRTYPECQ